MVDSDMMMKGVYSSLVHYLCFAIEDMELEKQAVVRTCTIGFGFSYFFFAGGKCHVKYSELLKDRVCVLMGTGSCCLVGNKAQ